MKISHWKLKTVFAAAAIGASLSSLPAQADMVGTKLFETTTLITQPQISLQALNISGAGTLSVQLTDLKWPDMLGTLSFTLFDATHVIGSYSLSANATTGVGSFNLITAGTYYASIFASPISGRSGGLYDAQIYFQSTAPVSLPAAAWLLISGLAGLAALGSKRPKQELSQMCA